MTPIPSPRSKKRARIEIIPLIDIIFFLLATFVMVSLSMVKNRAIPVNLPGAASGAPQEQKKFSTISIDATGNLFFNKEPMDDAHLEEALRQLQARETRSAGVHPTGMRKRHSGKAIAVLEEVRKAGITKVAIETRPKSTP